MIINLLAIDDHDVMITREKGVYRLHIDGLNFHNCECGVFYTFFDAAKFAHDIIQKIDYIKSRINDRE